MIDASGSELMLCDGEVLLLFRDLSYPAVCAILPDLGDGVLRIVVDPSKPNALEHVRLMVNEACDEPIPLDELATLSLPGLN